MAASSPEPDPAPVPVSDADAAAEVISEPWRLAALRPSTHESSTIPPPADAAAVTEPVESTATPVPVSEADASAEVISEPWRLAAEHRPEEVPAPPPASDTPAFEAPAPQAPAFEPSPNLEGAIASFNARHIVLFRALRAEIGAGAANFVRSCRAALDNGHADLFATTDLRSDGSWDPEGLKRSVIDHRVADAPDGFQKLLDGELQRLRTHWSDARAASLADQLASIP